MCSMITHSSHVGENRTSVSDKCVNVDTQLSMYITHMVLKIQKYLNSLQWNMSNLTQACVPVPSSLDSTKCKLLIYNRCLHSVCFFFLTFHLLCLTDLDKILELFFCLNPNLILTAYLPLTLTACPFNQMGQVQIPIVAFIQGEQYLKPVLFPGPENPASSGGRRGGRGGRDRGTGTCRHICWVQAFQM